MKTPLIAGLAALFFLVGCTETTETTTPETETDVVTPASSSALPYDIDVLEVTSEFPNLPALHSFCMATYNNSWIMLGGRINGLHSFNGSTGAADFPADKANTHIFVYDPNAKTCDSLDLSPLKTSNSDLYEALTATNAQHFSSGGKLYMCGGYIAEVPASNFQSTSDMFTVLDLSNVVAAVQAKDVAQLSSNIIHDDRVQYTGGEMFELDNGYIYLALGQTFNGSYNDYISDTTGAQRTAIQQYANQFSRFNIDSSTVDYTLMNYEAYLNPNATDEFSNELRRRDLNIVPAVNPNGTIGLTAYAGVFQCPDPPMCNTATSWPSAAYLEFGSGYSTPSVTIDNSVIQGNNVYACWNILAYDPTGQIMYTNFLGGIGVTDSTKSNYSDDPFTASNSTMVRNYNTSTTTQVLWAESDSLPGLLGAEGHFLPVGDTYLYTGSDEVFDLSKFPAQEATVIGYALGGIESSTGQSYKGKSWASNRIFKVVLSPL